MDGPPLPQTTRVMVKNVVVLALFLLGVAMAVPSTRAQLMDGVFLPLRDNLNARLVPSRLEAMADQLDVRLQRAEGFPGNWEGWLKRDYSGIPEDPWGNVYYLDIGRRDYTVGSIGADGEQNTEDDITVTRRLPGG